MSGAEQGEKIGKTTTYMQPHHFKKSPPPPRFCRLCMTYQACNKDYWFEHSNLTYKMHLVFNEAVYNNAHQNTDPWCTQWGFEPRLLMWESKVSKTSCKCVFKKYFIKLWAPFFFSEYTHACSLKLEDNIKQRDWIPQIDLRNRERFHSLTEVIHKLSGESWL